VLLDPDVELLKPDSISRHVAEAGFAEILGREVIPTITRMITATKPASPASGVRSR
jgi:hypothetical protein